MRIDLACRLSMFALVLSTASASAFISCVHYFPSQNAEILKDADFNAFSRLLPKKCLVKNFIFSCWRQNVRALPRHMIFGKVFEQEGPLGKGITVGKVKVSLTTTDRSSSSIFGLLRRKAQVTDTSSPSLAKMANEVCLLLLRKSEDWTAACSLSKWFSERDAGKAESLYNDWANAEAAKFEKEYIPASDDKKGKATSIVVTLIVEIQGDQTKFDGAGYSVQSTREVLSSIASDCLVDQGYLLNAAEVLWTPSEESEVLTQRELILDFPELIDL